MITTSDERLADRIDMLRNHGASISEEQRHHGPQPYLLPEFNLLGFNYRMTDLQGAIGLVQLKKLEGFIEQRRQWAEFYRRELADVTWLRTPSAPQSSRHGWQAYVCYVDPNEAPMPRNRIMAHLQDLGISTRPGTHAVHMLGYYRDTMGLEPDDFPGARDCDRHSMAIPLHNAMTDIDYQYVVQAIRNIEQVARAAA